MCPRKQSQRERIWKGWEVRPRGRVASKGMGLLGIRKGEKLSDLLPSFHGFIMGKTSTFL